MKKNNFLVFIGTVLFITISLISFGLYLYHKTGAYSLDLSHPNYHQIRQEIKKEVDDSKIKLSGEVNEAFADQVQAKFDYYMPNIEAKSVFSEEALSDGGLGIDVSR